MEQKFYRNKYSPLKGVARVATSAVVGYMLGLSYGLCDIEYTASDAVFRTAIGPYVTLGLLVGLSGGLVAERIRYSRSR